ncbi:MAG: universal stress protein [bacterium]
MSGLILFVIIDPTKEHQHALLHAAEIANIAGGHIHAFCAVYEHDMSHYESRRDAKRTVKNRAMDMVDDLIKPLANDQVTVAREIMWNDHWYQAAVHACARVGADYMVKCTDTHKKALNLLKARSDFYLLRHISCPVLLVHTVESSRYRRVLAAVAVENGDDGHDRLNNLVISEARRICRTTGGELHVLVTHKDRPNFFKFLGFRSDADDKKLPDEELISSHFGIETDKIHIASGPAKQAIVESATQFDAQLLVLGTISRAGVSGAVLGNTCEQILDELTIDILTVY